VDIGTIRYRLTSEEWVARADAALYGAKAAGRNRAVIEPDE